MFAGLRCWPKSREGCELVEWDPRLLSGPQLYEKAALTMRMTLIKQYEDEEIASFVKYQLRRRTFTTSIVITAQI
uniref:Uncharacterized protein n=1 Tax=Ascaris lumbricoides TaxID=6252 RepID=A0A0M3HX43_ASCLU